LQQIGPLIFRQLQAGVNRIKLYFSILASAVAELFEAMMTKDRADNGGHRLIASQQRLRIFACDFGAQITVALPFDNGSMA